MVADGDRPRTDDDLDRRRRRIELRSVVEHVVEHPQQLARLTTHGPGLSVDHDRATASPLGPGGGAAGEGGDVDDLGRLVVRLLGGERDELVGDVGQLPQLRVDVAEHTVTGRRLELGVAAEDLDVRAEARQGRAQLVAGVLREPLLLLP